MAVTCRSWLSDTPAQQITPTLVVASMGNALHLETLLDKGRTRSELRLQVCNIHLQCRYHQHPNKSLLQ